MNLYFAVFVGGGLGSLARFGVSKLISDQFQHINPTGTFIANILATITLSIVTYVFGAKADLPQSLKAMLATGFCGGFSTFSTFSYETLELLRMGQYVWAVANIFVSCLMALLALFLIFRISN